MPFIFNVQENIIKIEDVCFELRNLLWCFRLSSKSNDGVISIKSLLKTKRYLDARNINHEISECLVQELIEENSELHEENESIISNRSQESN